MPADDALTGIISAMKPAFIIHVGEIKSGSAPCTDENFATVRTEFAVFAGPPVYTHGDNGWTDCHRGKAGKFGLLERLARVRAMFFAQSGSFGQKPMPLAQRPAFIENARGCKGRCGVHHPAYPWQQQRRGARQHGRVLCL
ncbi:hypothetical protein [Deinococcus hopiensis]|uniref:hypothetical protein n=1 Tax=Deinococcus hopiensis TaxID=309885 RepID=UPI00111C02CB|nr:hypothetical protein [Deinococcus hopiensis]